MVIADFATPTADAVEHHSAMPGAFSTVLTPEALEFVAALARRFTPRIQELMREREHRRERWDAGEQLDFRSDTQHIRAGDWTVAPAPQDLRRRTVEITGPVDRKMIINALNSGADVFMADFEDASAPAWQNMVQGQDNLRDAVRRTITYRDMTSGKEYNLTDSPATLVVRPRGLHLPESHLVVDGTPVPGALFDAGMYLFHNAHELVSRGSGPYFYLPKLESAEEAALWNDVFSAAEEALELPVGTIRATVLIETLPAAFQMDEILYALRDHVVGLNCGRWDYIFSAIKTRRSDSDAIFPDRSQVSMTQPNMRAYTQLLVRTCHRRGAHAIGGMAAQIPVRGDEQANLAAFERVRADKLREVTDGHDGTWVAHPALVPVAREAFGAHMTGDNQLHRMREDVRVTADDLRAIPEGTVTEDGIRLNVRVGIQYIEAWLCGHGAVPLYNLMEDAATAEISRTQLWQWLHHNVRTDSGETVTPELIDRIIADEMHRIAAEVGPRRTRCGRFDDAVAVFRNLVHTDTLDEFLTLAALPLLEHDGPTLTVTG